MDENNLTAAEIEKEEGAAKSDAQCGKFRSSEELLKAYNSLESEFTKRSQKLKALLDENEKLNLSLQALNKDALLRLDDDAFVEENILKNDNISKKIIDGYLKEILQSGTPVPLGSKVGKSALTPVNKPKSLKEAKILADILLKS